MNATPPTRGYHALRWVLGVGVVFVVVVGMGLQRARARADERWERVNAHCEEELGYSRRGGERPTCIWPMLYGAEESTMRGGNVICEWRQRQWTDAPLVLILRQERNFFGSSIEARLSTEGSVFFEMTRAVLAEADVELVVVP